MTARQRPHKPEPTAVQRLIINECDAIKEMLLEKNASYGNSALDPMRVFSRAPAAEQLKVRIDDKLSRLARGSEFPDEDTVKDLIGYLLLYRVRLQMNAEGVSDG